MQSAHLRRPEACRELTEVLSRILPFRVPQSEEILSRAWYNREYGGQVELMRAVGNNRAKAAGT